MVTRFALWLLCFAILSGCGDEFSDATASRPDCDVATTSAAGDGTHTITVQHADGTEDAINIYASSPPGDGPFPVVVYARGMGPDNAVNCAVDESGVPLGVENYVDSLAAEGFLAIAISYRNFGSAAPSATSLQMRDHNVYDAGAMLAAAEWGRTEHGKGSARVALIGFSMGTWTATWAASTLPELAAAQACLDIETVVLQGESANHVANDHKVHERWESGDQPLMMEAFVGGAFVAVNRTVAQHRIARLDSGAVAGLPDIGDLLTDDGIELVELVMLTRGNPAIHPACRSDRAPICSEECLFATAQRAWSELEDPPAATPFDSLDIWLTSAMQEAVGYYTPPGQVDPAGMDSPMLQMMRAQSPAYTLDGLVAPRALHLLSAFDDHYREEARTRLGAKLEEAGAVVVAPDVAIDAGGQPCGHGDYGVASRPECGFRQTVEELHTAFR